MKLGQKNYKVFHMFSATMQPYVEKIAREYLKYPAYIQIGDHSATNDVKNIEQRIEFVHSESQRRQKLKSILERFTKRPIMIFTNHKSDVD